MIRPTALTDAALLAAIHQDCFGAEAWSEDAIAGSLNMLGSFGFLAHDDKQPHGFILCSKILDEAEILTLGVFFEWRRQGVASDLMLAVLEHAHQTGLREIFLEVSEQNHAAQELYAQNGFHEIQRRKSYYQTTQGQFDAIIMRWSPIRMAKTAQNS